MAGLLSGDEERDYFLGGAYGWAIFRGRRAVILGWGLYQGEEVGYFRDSIHILARLGFFSNGHAFGLAAVGWVVSGVNVTILGRGAWGTALACTRRGWGIGDAGAARLGQAFSWRRSGRIGIFPGFKLPVGIRLGLDSPVSWRRSVLLACPMRVLRGCGAVQKEWSGVWRADVLTLCKGME